METSQFPSPPTFSSSYHGSLATGGSEATTESTETKATNEALLRTTVEETSNRKSTVSLFQVNVNIGENFTDIFDTSQNFTHYFTTQHPEYHTTQASSRRVTVVEIGQNLEARDSGNRNAVSRDEMIEQKITFVKITPINSTKFNQSRHNVGENSLEESSGEENEGFLVLSKNSVKDEPKRTKNASSFVVLQRDEPSLRKLRRLPDQQFAGADLETDVNQQMWVLEPDEGGSRQGTVSGVMWVAYCSSVVELFLHTWKSRFEPGSVPLFETFLDKMFTPFPSL